MKSISREHTCTLRVRIFHFMGMSDGFEMRLEYKAEGQAEVVVCFFLGNTRPDIVARQLSSAEKLILQPIVFEIVELKVLQCVELDTSCILINL